MKTLEGGTNIPLATGSSHTQGYTRRAAFTLTELLVAMTLLSGLIFLLFSIVDGTTKTWNQCEQRVDAFREARAALFIIARDLQTMVPAPDFVNETLTGSDPDYLKPNGIADFKFFFVNPARTGTTDVSFSGVAEDTYGDRLLFLTAQPSAAQNSGAKSDVCSVGYYLDYTSSPATCMGGSPGTFKLYRYFKDSDATFASLKNYTSTPPTSSTLMQAGSSTDEVLAHNIVDFRVKAYDSSLRNISPWDTKNTPCAVDLSLTAYNYNAANRFSDAADWMNFTTVKNSSARQTFTTRIYLIRSGPPPTSAP